MITPTPSATPITPNAVLASFAGFSAAWMVLMATRYYALQASDINGALNVGFDTGSWLSTAYAVCEPIGVVIGAWLGIALALRRMLLMGVATFLIGSTLPLMVKGYDALMVSRIITGLAGGAIMPQSIIIQLRTWGPTRIPLALALFLSAPTAATLLGGLVGAWGVQHFDWSFVLWGGASPGDARPRVWVHLAATRTDSMAAPDSCGHGRPGRAIGCGGSVRLRDQSGG